MTQQLPLFPESTTEQPTEDTARRAESVEPWGPRARWDRRLDNFENWLRSLNKAKRTIRGYTTDIGQLLDFLEQEGRLEDVIDTSDLIDFLAEQQKAGARSRTLDRKRSAFKAFFGYLVRFKRIDDDPARRLGVPIADYELPLTLTESEVEGLLEAARDHPRDLAILRLFTDCGLRVSELCGLKLEDIDLEESMLYVKGRYVPLPPDARTDLKVWLRPEVPPEHDEGLDEEVGQAGGDRVFPIKPRAVRLVVKKYAAIAGIRKAVRPSLLRHTFAVLALVRGEDYEAVKLTLGHEIDDVMQQYVQRAHQLQVLRRPPHEQA